MSKKSNLKSDQEMDRRPEETFFQRYTGSHLAHEKMLSMTSYQVNMQIKTTVIHFPVGPVVKNLPCNAEATSSIPGLRRSPMPWDNKVCMSQLLSPCPGACKLQLPSPCATATEACALQSLCSATREATAMRSLCVCCTREQPPLTTARESPHTASKTQCSQK